MKKTISFILAIIMLFSGIIAGNSALAAEKKYAADVLAEIQKTSGFIPNQTAAVVGNCYGFISAVCEKLYGVKYQEGLNSDGYTCQHKTGYFYTVKTYKTESSDTSACVEDIISFFVNNAYPGDVVHYASLSGSSHTFMIQSIDSEKMQIFHSNYQTRTLSSSACHIDTIYWSSFRSNPTSTIYNSDGTMYSHNSLFYNKQKRGGLGMTINRFTDYEKKFYPTYVYYPPELSLTRTSCTSIKMKWNPVKGAVKYRVQYKKNSASAYTTLSESYTDTSFDVKNLTVGTKYNFRVCAYAGGKWGEYSNVVSKKALPPMVSSVSFKPASSALKLSWAKKTDLTSVKIYKSATQNGTFTLLATLGGNADSYHDTAVKYGVANYYKVERIKTVGDKDYSTTSKAFSGTYTLKTPVVSYTRPDATSITFMFNGDACQDSFDYYLVSDSNPNSTATINTDEASLALENLNLGEHYTLYVREKTKLGVSAFGSLTVQAAPRPVTLTTAEPRTNGIRVEYKTQEDADGYYVFRSSGGAYANIGKVSGKSRSVYLDKTVKYNTNYQYIVRSYAVTESGAEVLGDIGAASALTKVYLAAPTGVKAARTSPTRVTVSWNAVGNAVKYELQYKYKGGKWITVSNIKKTSRLIKNLTTGKKYFFRVRAVNAVGSGGYSKKVSQRVLPPAPQAPTLKTSGSGIKVSYKPKSYASGYYIYRAAKSGGKYRLIATVEGHKKKSYTDYNVTRGKTYYYKIVCIVTKNGKRYKSAKSPAASLTLS